MGTRSGDMQESIASRLASQSTRHATRSPRRGNGAQAHDIGYCDPGSESDVWRKSRLTKASPASQERTLRAHPADSLRLLLRYRL